MFPEFIGRIPVGPSAYLPPTSHTHTILRPVLTSLRLILMGSVIFLLRKTFDSILTTNRMGGHRIFQKQGWGRAGAPTHFGQFFYKKFIKMKKIVSFECLRFRLNLGVNGRMT